ncbi:MAG: OmpH family outer membrane protein [Flavobacteriales bacterium]|nr:OmpH family outer membrane protein [Flavobacteriales bacterium]MBK7553575.1 OmpH family outer membrane protein [Flavobacteriales bacterium]
MSKNTSILLIVWNVVLTALVVFGLVRGTSTGTASTSTDSDTDSSAAFIIPLDSTVDRSALKEARIAFFDLDTLNVRLDLVKDQRARYTSVVSQLENKLAAAQKKGQDEVDAILAQDPTYATKAEYEKNVKRVQELEEELGRMNEKSAEELQRLEMQLRSDLNHELVEFLKEYNSKAGYDYVIMMQPGGQVWPGNPGLDISYDLIAGMNASYAARKGKK